MEIVHHELGQVRARYRAKRFPWWLVPVALLVGAMAVLFALDGSGDVRSWGTLAVGVIVAASGVVGPIVQPRFASSVDVHEQGLVFGRPSRKRVVRWQELRNAEISDRVASANGLPVRVLTLTLTRHDGTQEVLPHVSCATPEPMMQTVAAFVRAYHDAELVEVTARRLAATGLATFSAPQASF